MINNCGIYKIINIVNNKIYIGQSINMHKRKLSHLKTLRKNIHSNKYLQHSFNKYGEDSFVFEIIESCNQELLNRREFYWIDECKSYLRDFGYNIDMPSIENDTYFLSEETRKKISDANKIYSDEELIAFLINYYEKFGKVPTQNDINNNCGYPSATVYKYRFGSFSNAIILSELNKFVDSGRFIEKKSKYTKEEVTECVNNFVYKNNKYPQNKDFDNDRSLPTRGVIKRLFGSVENCMIECGYDDYKDKKNKIG